MIDNELNEKYLNWTPSALDCYFRRCRCKGCPLFEILETPCLMKYTVIQIIKKQGKPSENIQQLDINFIIKELETGKSLKQIARILKVDYQSLIQFTKGSGISAHKYKGGDLCRGRNNRN